jgi:hypothetical protein
MNNKIQNTQQLRNELLIVNYSTLQTAESRTINSVGQRPAEQNTHNTQAPQGRNHFYVNALSVI